MPSRAHASRARSSQLRAYVDRQWHLFMARLRGMRIQGRLSRHQRSGVLATVLFCMHSVHIGYGYLAAPSWVFLILATAYTARRLALPPARNVKVSPLRASPPKAAARRRSHCRDMVEGRAASAAPGRKRLESPLTDNRQENRPR